MDTPGFHRAGRFRKAATVLTKSRLAGVLFGHRRLSILDLSPAGHQPFLNKAGSMVLAYNGEVYNYVELREELIGQGVQFRSSSDTEVVLAAYERWGTEAFRRFNGMWACALWDSGRKKLVVSRDRFGIKPLYFTVVEDTWIFASELKPIIRFPGVDRSLNDGQILEFLTSGMVNHNEATFFSAVRSVPPATVIELVNGRASSFTYWTLDPSRDKRTDADAVEKYRELLQDAVRIRSRSDVPIGTMLSGGLDSTSITALIVQQSRLGGSNESESRGLSSFHNTFTACWPDVQAVDEEAEVDLMCAELGLASQKIYPSAEEIRELLPRVTYFLDEPFENPVSVIQYMLMQKARESGVKVVLNGHGSDEALAGYPDAFVAPFLAGLLLSGRLSRFWRERRAFGRWNSNAEILLECAWSLTPQALRPRLIQLVRQAQHHDSKIFVDTDRKLWSRADVDIEVAGRMPPLDAGLWRSYRAAILPRWLRMEDRMSMAHGVESRLPFTDYRLVEFTFQLADTMKLRDGYTKFILRQAMQGLLPASIAQDRRKRRFEAPYSGWFRHAWRPMIEDLLLDGACHVQPYLNLPSFRSKLAAYLRDDDRAMNTSTLWRILQTEIWLHAFAAGESETAGAARPG